MPIPASLNKSRTGERPQKHNGSFQIDKKSRYHHRAAALRGFTTGHRSPKAPDEPCNIMGCELDGECKYYKKSAKIIYVLNVNKCMNQPEVLLYTTNFGQKKPQQEGGNCCGTKTQDMGRVLA